MDITSSGRQELDFYINILKFLNESTDDYFFLCDLELGRLYFFGSISKRYALLQNGERYCMLDDWYKIVYKKDLPALQDNINQIISGKLFEHNMEYRIIDKKGNRVWISCRGKCQMNAEGKQTLLVGRVSDTVLVQKTDPLTGAFNKHKLTEDIEEIQKNGLQGYLLVVGIDNFRHINIRYGRTHGNKILKEMAAFLEDIADATKVYRLDGDCFAVNFPFFDKKEIEQVYNKLRDDMSAYCTISGGAVSYQNSLAKDAYLLYQFAEEALDRAKKKGKDVLSFFSLKDYERKVSDIELQDELQQSIQNGFEGFFLCYQPQISPKTYQLFGVETLLRYRSNVRGVVSPAEFIPILEKTGMINAAGQWVLETALEQCRQWRRFFPDLHVSVNISYVQLLKKDMNQIVLDVLDKSGIPGNALTLEVTESMHLQDYPNLNKLFYQWKKYGIGLAVDDFGTGYSSLSYLKNMEIDEIKIDRCFVSGIQHSAYNYRLLSNMVELAKSSQIRVCCEGVETEEELHTLEQLHPDLLQGFLFGKPYTKEQFEEIYIQENSKAYVERVKKEQACCKKVAASLPETSLMKGDNLDVIMGALDEIIYVSDVETYELYYLNPAGRSITGVHDYKGRKCYKVLQGRSDPCEFCTNKYLRRDSFYTWDRENTYLQRHFILKDKLIDWNEKTARLEYAIDVTAQEIICRNTKEELNFAQNIVGCAQTLVEEEDMKTAILRMLQDIGQFYQADRAYLFEPVNGKPDYWSNTYEWCKSGVSEQKHNLQELSSATIGRWLGIFAENKSVIISNMDDIRYIDRGEWEILSAQDIHRLIACPIRVKGRLAGFIGVDNPRHCIFDDAQIRTMTVFIANRFQSNETAVRLGELLNLHYRDILRATEVGLWFIRMNKEENRFEMYADENMKNILGIRREMTPEECYHHWYDRINDGYYHYVNLSIEAMLSSENIVQLQYTWDHPAMGEVLVRCTGVRAQDDDGCYCLEGYHRIVSNMSEVKFLPDTPSSEMFEYNERKAAVYFHTGRTLIEGNDLKEKDFPNTWIEQEIIHPHFIEKFCDVFRDVKSSSDLDGMEIMLKTKSGNYSWFRMKTRHLSNDVQDRNTILVLLNPANQERRMELECQRLKDFYKASLAETIAYAEVDLESGQLQDIGGIWKQYEEECRESGLDFLHFLAQKLDALCQVTNKKDLWVFLDHVDWDKVMNEKDRTQRFTYRRLFGKEWRWVELVMHVFQEQFSQNMFALLYLKDIEMQKRRELEQREAANRDPLTRVFNRNAFEEEVFSYMNENENNKGVLILLDIDDFKNINDSYGHLIGDKMLKHVTNQLQKIFRSKDVVGRLGGDEFLVFIKGDVSREILDTRMKKLFDSLQKNIDTPISCSAGIIFVSKDNFSYEDILRQADIALYRSKQVGKRRYFYAEDIEK